MSWSQPPPTSSRSRSSLDSSLSSYMRQAAPAPSAPTPNNPRRLPLHHSTSRSSSVSSSRSMTSAPRWTRFPSPQRLAMLALCVASLVLLAQLTPSSADSLAKSPVPAKMDLGHLAVRHVAESEGETFEFVAERVRYELDQHRFEVGLGDEEEEGEEVDLVSEEEERALRDEEEKAREYEDAELGEEEDDAVGKVEGEYIDDEIVEDFDEERAVVESRATAPTEVCKKSFTYKLANKHGLGSEVGLLIRAYSVARYFGYNHLFIDDSDWNFGKWTDYFEPIVNDCLPPPADQLRSMGLHKEEYPLLPRAPAYTEARHLSCAHRDVFGLDATFLALFTDAREVEALQAEDERKLEMAEVKEPVEGDGGEPLEGRLVPPAFVKAYQAHRAALLDVWKPNALVRSMMENLKSELGLDRVHDLASAEDVVVGVHCRTGDKFLELKHRLPISVQDAPNRAKVLRPKLISAFFDAARGAVGQILKGAGIVGEAYDFASAPVGHGRPTMALMSDDADAIDRFEDHPKARRWRLRSTNMNNGAVELKVGKGRKTRYGFSEAGFNELPLELRVASARKFVTDLTVLATSTDALVLTASSNVGRLMALLAGEEKAIKQGRITSLDTRWFPTAFFL